MDEYEHLRQCEILLMSYQGRGPAWNQVEEIEHLQPIRVPRVAQEVQQIEPRREPEPVRPVASPPPVDRWCAQAIERFTRREEAQDVARRR